MDTFILQSIKEKYTNPIFPALPMVLNEYLQKNPKELTKFLNPYIRQNTLLKYLASNSIHTRSELLSQTIEYVEAVWKII